MLLLRSYHLFSQNELETAATKATRHINYLQLVQKLDSKLFVCLDGEQNFLSCNQRASCQNENVVLFNIVAKPHSDKNGSVDQESDSDS